jgi:hypothetical protein
MNKVFLHQYNLSYHVNKTSISGYQHLRGTNHHIHPKDGDDTFLCKTNNHLQIICFGEMMVTTYKAIQRHNPEGHDPHYLCCENLIFQKSIVQCLTVHCCFI